MKFSWSDEKDDEKRKKYPIGFKEIRGIFYGPWAPVESPYPGQHRAVGFAASGGLYTVAYRDLADAKGNEVIELITFWKATKTEEEAYNEVFS